jgi:hypothetical protein
MRRPAAFAVTIGLAYAGASSAGDYPTPASQGLRPARGYSWLCAGGPDQPICHRGVPKSLRRPVRIGRTDAGASCPRSPVGRVSPKLGVALGAGPAFPIPFPEGTLHFDGGRSEGGWIYVKVLWVAGPRYRGPVLIRGRQMDGTNWLGFERGAHPLAELQLPPLAQGAGGRWRDFPSYTRVRGSGCYAYQVDGTSFSRVLVFSVAA